LPSSVLAIGLGTCDVAVGLRQSRPAYWWSLVQGRRLRDISLAGVTAPPRITTQHRVEMEPGQRFTEQGAIGALCTALAEASGDSGAIPGGADAMIVVDDFWANHGILRGDFRSMRAREVEDVARAYFVDAFGLEGDAILVRTALQPDGMGLFSTAIPASLHAGIHEACAAARVRVKHLLPGLPRMLNCARRAIDGHPGMLVLVAESLLQIVVMDGRHWRAYDVQRLFAEEASDPTQLAEDASRMLERWSAVRPEDCPVYLGGIEVDEVPFSQRFAAVHRLPDMPTSPWSALRLMELAP